MATAQFKVAGKASEDSAWWEEGTQPEVEELEPEAEMDAASDIESLLRDEEDHCNVDEQGEGNDQCLFTFEFNRTPQLK